MQERSPEQGNIEITDLNKQTQERQTDIKQLQEAIQEKFPIDPAVIGNLMFGSKAKRLGSDGNTEETPWTMDGLLEEMEKNRKEELIGIKHNLAVDTIAAIQSQEKFFSATEHPLGKDSANNSAFVLTLLERVLSSDEKIGESFPIDEPKEEYWTAELLEVIRRTVLKPTTLIIEGIGEWGIRSVPGYAEEDFWEQRKKLITDEMRNERDTDKYHKLEKERQKRALESRGEDEWKEVLEEESMFLRDYLGEVIRRTLKKNIEIANFAQVLTFQGKRVASDEVLTEYSEKITRVTTLQTEYAKIQEVLPWIKKNFGEDADFQTFLQFLNPIKLNL